MAVIFSRTSELMVKHFFNALTEGEEKEFNDILSTSPSLQSLLEEMNNRELLAAYLKNRNELNVEKSWERFVQRYPWKKKRPILKIYLSAAAAMLSLFLCIFYIIRKDNHQQTVTALESTKKSMIFDSTLMRLKNILTFSDNSKAILEDKPNGELKREGNTIVIKQGRLLIYNQLNGLGSSILLNNLSTQQQGIYQIQLPDGSNVWLNGASSIEYPTRFAGAERKVTIRGGEAYFEVSRDATHPFKVITLHSIKGNLQSAKDTVEFKVLGTHFNINAYDNEDMVRATVTEGMVNILYGSQTRLLKRGQLAEIGDSRPISIRNKSGVEKSIAWKQGDFDFANDNLQIIMRALSRWYNVTINYKGPISSAPFALYAPREKPLHVILETLKKNNRNFYYKIENNIITASSSPLP